MAYPYGAYNDEIINILKMCKVAYSRTVCSTESFGFPKEWLMLHPTAHHRNPKLMEITERFIKGNRWNNAEMLYLWGHSYEFDDDDNWDVIEKFAEKISGRDDIWYATNIEIYDYVKAYESLVTSTDKKIIYNPSAVTVWFAPEVKSEVLCVKPGETISL